MKMNRDLELSLQLLLWLWFGIITSFTAVNTANIIKLENQVKMLNDNTSRMDKIEDAMIRKMFLIK